MVEATEDRTGGQDATGGLTTSDRHRLLADERRRSILAALADLGTPIALEELAEEIAVRESGDQRPPVDTRDRVTISLHHHHLPMMADLGVIEYYPEAGWVEAHHASFDRLIE